MQTAPATARKPAPDAVFHRLALVPMIAGIESTDERAFRLSRAEAQARYELGRAAARFLSIKGWERLAFARIGDYARERLGFSGRELQSFAFVASRLAGLPLVAAAFLSGEISWSRTRLVCAVADADSESVWLERVRGRTVRELVVEIRRSETAIAAGAPDTLDDESDATDGEPRTQFSILVPPRVAFLWRRALELARRMLGSQAPVWQAAEAIVAEASSAVPIDVDESPSLPVGERPTPKAAREGEPNSDDPDLPSRDPFALDDEMRDLAGILSQIDAELGASLRRVVDLRLHRALGFDSFDSYARERLGISPAKARALVALERRSRESRELGRAYRSGALSWVRALAISPVAEGAFESAWVARASEIMVRRLQDEVEWALDMRDACDRPAAPPEAGLRLERPDLQTCASEANPDTEVANRRVTFFGPASVVLSSARACGASPRRASRPGRDSSAFSATPSRSGNHSLVIATRSSSARAGAVGLRGARRGGASRIITSSFAHAAAATSSGTASPSARGITTTRSIATSSA